MQSLKGLAFVAVMASGSMAMGAIAYNDTGNTTTPPGGKFVTNIGNNASGSLLDYDTGATIGTLALGNAWTNTTSGATIGSAGTPLYNHFNGFLDLTGAIYGSVGNTLTFSGLSPSSLYTVTLGVNRNTAGGSGAYWYQSATIAGVDAFTNTSTIATIADSATTTIQSRTSSSDATTYVTANNNDQAYGMSGSDPSKRPSTDGAIVQYSSINPGSDGTFTLAVNANVGTVYFNGLSLAVVPEPASLGLLGLGGLLLTARRRRTA